MSHSQVRPQSGDHDGALRPKQCIRRTNVYVRAPKVICPSLLYFTPNTKTRFHLLEVLAACVSIALSGCGGLTYRSSNSLQGSSGSAAAVTLSSISCGTLSLTGAQSRACTVNLNAPATSTLTVSLTSNNASLRVPGSVTVAAGASSASFNAVSSAVGQQISVTISASANGNTITNVITLYPVQVTLAGLSCSSQSLIGPTTTPCSISVNSAAPSSTVVSLSSNSKDLTVPTAITLPAGAITGPFNATAASVSATETVTLAAALNGVTQTFQIQLHASTASPSVAYNVQLNWAVPSSSPTAIAGYRVYRADGGGGSSAFAAVNSALAAQTAYVDSTVQNGQTYGYRVTSVDTTGAESAPSNTITVSIPN